MLLWPALGKLELLYVIYDASCEIVYTNRVWTSRSYQNSASAVIIVLEAAREPCRDPSMQAIPHTHPLAVKVVFVGSSLKPCKAREKGGASSVHAVRGLICTRGQGPRLYTRNGFAVCTTVFLQPCISHAPCVQVHRYRSLAIVLQVQSCSSW